MRWTHVFSAILWVGSTYYFTWLDGQMRSGAHRAAPSGWSTAAASTPSSSRRRWACPRRGALVPLRGAVDVPQRVRAPEPRLLPRRADGRSDRSDGHAGRGGHDRRRVRWSSAGSSTTCSSGRRSSGTSRRSRAGRPDPHRRGAVGALARISARAPPTSTSARSSARSWSRTSGCGSCRRSGG